MTPTRCTRVKPGHEPNGCNRSGECTLLIAVFGLSLGVAVTAAGFAPTPSAMAQPEGELRPVAIGLVRSDGILFPLGRLENGVWTPLSVDNPATGGSQLTAAARSLARMGWSAFPLAGTAPFPLAIRGIASVDSHCVKVEGFRTNAPTRPYPPHTFPRPKTAIAVWGDGTVAQSERVSAPYDSAARRAARIIVAFTQSVELERAEAQTNSPLAKYTAAERGQVPVQVTTMARRTFFARTPHYFEARKRYASGFDLLVTGWLVMSEEAIEMTQATAAVTDDDYKGVETANVLGVVELGDRAMWLLEAHGYESEAYVLMEFVPFDMGRRVLRIEAGGC